MKKLINKAIRKLKQRSGESLTEVLVALLIGTLALAMLASMIGSTTRLIRQSQETMEAYYARTAELATKTGSSTEGYATVSVGGSTWHLEVDHGGASADSGRISISYFINTNAGSGTPVISYEKKEAGGDGND